MALDGIVQIKFGICNLERLHKMGNLISNKILKSIPKLYFKNWTKAGLEFLAKNYKDYHQ